MNPVWTQLGGFFALLGFVALVAEALWRRTPRRSISYVAALTASALWLAAEGVWGWREPATGLAEAVRNMAWLWFMATIAGQRDTGGRLSAIGWIYVVLFAVNLLAGLLGWLGAGDKGAFSAVVLALPPAKMLFVAGALVLLHNLYDSARTDERRALSLPIAAMGTMWAYDLNLYAIAYLAREPAVLMEMVRPAASQILVLILAMAALRPGAQAVRLSRPVAFRSLALAGVAAWLCLLAASATVASMAGIEFSWRAQVGVLLIGVLGSALLLMSERARATMKVWVAKHFFEHRYDYRAEWLRFTATLHNQRSGHSPLAIRVVQAIGDIVEAHGGALLAEDDAGRMTLSGDVSGSLADLPTDADAMTLALHLAASDRIIQFDEVRAGLAPESERAAVPAWLLACDDLWVGVPLIHQQSVRGIVLLTRPAVARSLDWEDFDLLRVAGRQAASYLAEARGSEALLESRRFEEFHRRFAFVMHDVKNLASQLGLLARNIERHGENPDFREDMTATVKLAAERLQSLTARLSEQDRVRVQRVAEIDAAAIARRVAAAKRAAHPVEVHGADFAVAKGDADLLERLLGHLVQNAIDASATGSVVRLDIAHNAQSVLIQVTDHGAGMSAEFMRTSLFRPFVSTKEGGFGIGAFQARQFAEAMGGTLTVSSREGTGTCFTVTLPMSEVQADQEAA
jgi:putative PEP-CTERM system histidine kinase